MKQVIFLVAFFQTIQLFSQSNFATGIVRDFESKEILPYTNIGVEGSSRGTVSNLEGAYVLDLNGLSAGDVVVFSRMGYNILKIRVSELKTKNEILLKMGEIELGEFQVSDKELKVKEIVELVDENFSKNHPKLSHKQRLFFHTYENTPIEDKNQIVVKESDFAGIDQKLIDQVFEGLPDEIISYNDMILDFYALNGQYKISPVEGISLQEGSQDKILKDAEKKLNVLLKDIDNTKNNKDIYYEFKTGIFSVEIENNSETDTLNIEGDKDSSFVKVSAEANRYSILNLYGKYANKNSDNWEFVTSPRKYRYTKEGYVMNNDEVVHKIAFTPKNGGLFKGTMYVSTTSYAILQVDFEFAENKKDENFHLLGFGHSITYRKGQVMYEKSKEGYYVKYINAEEHEFISVERKFSILKKKRRFLLDKELQEFKMKTALFFETQHKWELLILNQEKLEKEEFEKVKEPEKIKLKKQIAYSKDMWKNPSVIAPTQELKAYKRQHEGIK